MNLPENLNLDIQNNRKEEWESSYGSGDNMVFYPHEEVIRFVSRFIKQKTGLDSFEVSQHLASLESTLIHAYCQKF